MTIDQVEGNEPIHENFGTQLGDEIDEVDKSYYYYCCSSGLGCNSNTDTAVCADTPVVSISATEHL